MFSCKLFGIKIEVSFTFFIMIAVIIISGNSIFVIAALVCSLLHEYAHALVAKVLGYTSEKISAGLFGGILHLREGFINPIHELFIHLAGPFFNVMVAFIGYIINIAFDIDSSRLDYIILANIVLALFNLMPFYPLDGGKIMNLYFGFFFGYGKALKISKVFSKIFSLILFLAGLYLMQYNILNAIVCALSINLYLVARQENSFIFYKMTKTMEESSSHKSDEKYVVCPLHTRGLNIIETYKPHQNRIFTIVNKKGHYKGQLSEDEVLQGVYECGIYSDLGRLLDHKRNNHTKSQNKHI